MSPSRFALILIAAGCGHTQEPTVPPPSPSTPDAVATTAVVDAAVAPQDAATAASMPEAAAPPPTAQDLCVDSGQRVHLTVSVSGCGLKLGKASTDEQRPGVVHLIFATKSTCKQMKPVNLELMTNPLQQRRFQLIVDDDGGQTYADQMVSTGSLPACKR